MKGFKDSTRVQYMKGGSCEGYAKGGSVKGAAKISKVMGEFKAGTLHSGSKKGPEVTSKKQATAIALSEARKAGAKIVKKEVGGPVTDPRQVQMNSKNANIAARADRLAARDERRQEHVAARDARHDEAQARHATEAARPVPRGPAGAGFNARPAVGGRQQEVQPNRGPGVAMKKGGLSAMPKGKGGKC